MSHKAPPDILHYCPLCEVRDISAIQPPTVAIGARTFADCPLGLYCCNQCGVRFINPRPSPQKLAEFYTADGYECHDTSGASDPDIRLNIVERFSNSGRLCDFGAGAGQMLRAASKRGWSVYGVEPGRSRSNLMSEGFQVYPDLSDLPSVDVVTMVHVLEHLPDPLSVLLALRQTTRFIYIEVPNADSLRARLAASFLKPFWTHAPERFLAFPIHLFYFNSRSLARLLKRAGFTIIAAGTLGLGVEELFQPSVTTPKTPEHVNNTAITSARNYARFSAVRKLVKQAFSRLRLGENLYVVATPAALDSAPCHAAELPAVNFLNRRPTIPSNSDPRIHLPKMKPYVVMRRFQRNGEWFEPGREVYPTEVYPLCQELINRRCLVPNTIKN